MNFKALSDVVTSKAGTQLLRLRGQSPTILFVAGVVGVVATVVVASRATLKLDKVLEETQNELDEITIASTVESYTEQDAKKAKVKVYATSAIRITGLYLPAVSLGILSIAALTGSHIVLTKRNSSLTAAYITVDKAFKEYRKRVVADQGEDKDREYRYDMQDKEVAVDTPEGVVVKTIKVPGPGALSGYARLWDENTSWKWQKTWSYNQMLLECQRSYANQKLQADGYLFLNQVHEMLGLSWTEEGQIVGWIKGQGDDFVDFGMFNRGNESGMEFVNGNERSVLLDFNVQGPIHKRLQSSREANALKS